MDIVLQGPADTYTVEIAEHYLQLDFVNTVIISCWKGNQYGPVTNPRIKVVFSEDVEFPGLGNRNRQIYSSLLGLQNVTTPFSAKMRSDQKVSLEGMKIMYSFYEKNKERKLTFHDTSERPLNQICVAGIFPSFPFHPRDHTYWGNTQDLIDIFSIPYDLTSDPNEYIYTKWLRSEAYIASHYYSRFDPRVSKFIENFKEYLVDGAPSIKDTLEVNNQIITKVFLPFPKVEFAWPKYEFYTHNNYYEYTEQTYGEYWSPSDNIETIRYISGGLLGDLIHQLSIIKEKYIETGKKGVLYITNSIGEIFGLGIERAYTDTFPFISKQSYIHEYKIHAGEPYDINLTAWRANSLLFKINIPTLFGNQYCVKWGAHPWIEEGTIAIKPHFKDVIFISIGLRRYPNYVNFKILLDKYKDDTLVFLSQSINEYNEFKSKSGIELPVYISHTLEDLVSSINSCKLLIANSSSPLTFAYAFHKKNISLIEPLTHEFILFNGMDNVIPNCQLYAN